MGIASLHPSYGLIAVAHTTVIFAPRTLLRISEEISASNVMVDADFSAA